MPSQRNHGRAAEVAREPADTNGQVDEPAARVDRQGLAIVLRAEEHPQLPGRERRGRTGSFRLLGREDDDDRRRDAERDRDCRQCCSGTSLVPDEVSKRQARRDREAPGHRREHADRHRPEQQRPEDRPQEPGDDQRRRVSIRERETGNAGTDQCGGHNRRVARRPRQRRSPDPDWRTSCPEARTG
jgi:hypothetical protein